jgi:hypothetical protein
MDQRELCKRCLRRSCVGFRVADDTWNRVIQGRWNVVCLPCFDELAYDVGEAWDRGVELFPVSRVTAERYTAYR